MLTYEELLTEIKRLPAQRRLSLIEAITHTLRGEVSDETEGVRGVPASEVRGIGKVEGQTPPTDEEIREDYTNYLIEKYLRNINEDRFNRY